MSKIVTVIGPNKSQCTSEIYQFGEKLGEALVDAGKFIVTGGMLGIMEAVFKGAHQSSNYQSGMTIGILPGSSKKEANQYADIVIPSGMGISRNQLVVNTGDVVVAIAGGAGTLSEIAFAWQLDKKIICYEGFGGWSEKLAREDLDSRKTDWIKPAQTLEEIIELIND